MTTAGGRVRDPDEDDPDAPRNERAAEQIRQRNRERREQLRPTPKRGVIVQDETGFRPLPDERTRELAIDAQRLMQKMLPTPEVEEEYKSQRRKLQERTNSPDADPLFDRIYETAMAQTKGQWVDIICRHCNKPQKHLIQVLDLKAQLAAAEFLLNQGDGRPGEQKPETASLVVNRRVIYSSEEDEE